MVSLCGIFHDCNIRSLLRKNFDFSNSLKNGDRLFHFSSPNAVNEIAMRLKFKGRRSKDPCSFKRQLYPVTFNIKSYGKRRFSS